MWKRTMDAFIHYLPPNKYVVQVPLYTSQIPCGVEWKVKEENHELLIYGVKRDCPVNGSSCNPLAKDCIKKKKVEFK